jgi:hypothetical protein
MSDRPTELERAFQLAKTGRLGSVDEIRRRLRAEGYYADHITGKGLYLQLRALMKSTRIARPGDHDSEQEAARMSHLDSGQVTFRSEA